MKVGENCLIKIIEEKVVTLLKQNDAKCVDSIFDASFIKAWGTRDPLDNQTGYSNREARVGRAGRTFGLGYKLHLSIDSATMLPLACTFAFANQNEQKHSLNILKKTELILKQSEAKLRSVIADSQYSDGKLRRCRGSGDSVSFKPETGLTVNKVRGLGNVASDALFSILCLVLNREAAENIGRYDKAVLPTYFNT